MFENVIGYDTVKNELLKFYDIMAHPENYTKFGAAIPKGILLYGPPGVGKTLCAMELVNNVKRRVFIITMDTDFAERMKDAFEEAKRSTPAIIFIDDMDKMQDFGYDNFNILQSLIDSVRMHDIFIIATANSTKHLPESLTRPGRFDRVVYMDVPPKKVSCEIVKHYLSNKPIDKYVDIDAISRMLGDKSCATLESVVNMASIYAGYEKSDTIQTNHLIEAILAVVYDKPASDYYGTQEDIATIAYHEAGHVVVSEVISPGSSILTTIRRKSDDDGCFSASKLSENTMDVNTIINDIHVSLGGRAATEIAFGRCDIGTSQDMQRATFYIMKLAQLYGYYGFYYVVPDSWFSPEFRDNVTYARADSQLYVWLEKYYAETKSILTRYWKFVDTVAKELMRKETLVAKDIRDIKDYIGYQWL